MVQLAMILIVTIGVFVAGFYIDKISISLAGYLLATITAIAGGALYLSIGQAVVGRIQNPETVNSTVRLIYFVFIMVGMFAELGVLPDNITKIAKWSPYGVVRRIVSSSLQPELWKMDDTTALLITFGYTILFATLGIKWFKWSSK